MSGRGRDVPDVGMCRYQYFGDEKENINKDIVNKDVDDITEDNDPEIIKLNMGSEQDEDCQRDDEVDGHLLPRDQSDLAELTRQNGTNSAGQEVKTWPPVYKKIDVIFSIISLLMYAGDLVTDILLVVTYHLTGQTTLRDLTLGFILVPAIVSGFVSVVWSCIDYANHPSHNRSKLPMVIRCMFTFFQLGRMYRIVEFLYHMNHTWKEKDEIKRKDISHKAIQQKRDAAILGLVDGFLESALQLLLQLYLLICNIATLDVLKVLALLTSWGSTSLTVTAYYRTVRRAIPDRRNVRYVPSGLYLAYRLFELGPRFLLLSLATAYFLNYVIGAVSIHVVLAFIMYKVINPKLEGICYSQILRDMFLLLISFISVFCFINLTDGSTWRRKLLYYIVFYVENFVILGLVVFFMETGSIVYSPWWYTAFSVVPGLVLHVIFMVVYYKFFHPTKTAKEKYPHEKSAEVKGQSPQSKGQSPPGKGPSLKSNGHSTQGNDQSSESDDLSSQDNISAQHHHGSSENNSSPSLKENEAEVTFEVKSDKAELLAKTADPGMTSDSSERQELPSEDDSQEEAAVRDDLDS